MSSHNSLTCDGDDVACEVEDDVLHLLSAGRAEEAMTRLDDRRSTTPSDLFDELGRVDARLRTLTVEVPELQRLLRRVERTEEVDGRFRVWVQAMICERLLLDGDPTAIVIAKVALDEVTCGVLPPVLVAYGLARLKRVAAIGWLITPTPESLAAHRALIADAVSDLIRCGFREGAAGTAGLSAGAQAVLWGEQVDENLAALLEDRACLAENDRSLWPATLDTLIVMAGLIVGDQAAVEDALDRLEHPAVEHPYSTIARSLGRALLDVVVTEGSSDAVASLEVALGSARATHPRVTYPWQWLIVNLLADVGSSGAARCLRGSVTTALDSPAQQIERDFLMMRIASLEGDPPTASEVKELVEQIAATGRTRHAAAMALRLSRDLGRAGAGVDAVAVHMWGSEHLPPPSRRTIWEHALVGELEEPESPGVPRAGDVSVAGEPARPRICVLRPSISIEIEGSPVAISEMPAKLLLTVLLAHPMPVHVEQLCDVLWPDAPLSSTRDRLNTAMHRLRRLLRPDGEVVGRQGDLVFLVEDQLDVDLLRYRQSLASTAGDRAGTLASVRGNLCDAQFPYDDVFLDARRVFEAEWLEAARRLCRRDGRVVTRFQPALAGLGLTTESLLEP